MYVSTQVIASGTARCDPNSSIPMIAQVKGVFAAPANTATNPNAAKREGSWPVTWANALPRVAPIQKIGVTSPPLKHAPKVTAVKTSLTAKA